MMLPRILKTGESKLFLLKSKDKNKLSIISLYIINVIINWKSTSFSLFLYCQWKKDVWQPVSQTVWNAESAD